MKENEDSVEREMPRYRCHKEVWALKISNLMPGVPDDGTLLLESSDRGYAPFILDAEFVTKHKPVVGGYYVVYKDGYKSFSPAIAFEEGYTRI